VLQRCVFRSNPLAAEISAIARFFRPGCFERVQHDRSTISRSNAFRRHDSNGISPEMSASIFFAIRKRAYPASQIPFPVCPPKQNEREQQPVRSDRCENGLQHERCWAEPPKLFKIDAIGEPKSRVRSVFACASDRSRSPSGPAVGLSGTAIRCRRFARQNGRSGSTCAKSSVPAAKNKFPESR